MRISVEVLDGFFNLIEMLVLLAMRQPIVAALEEQLSVEPRCITKFARRMTASGACDAGFSQRVFWAALIAKCFREFRLSNPALTQGASLLFSRAPLDGVFDAEPAQF